MDYIKLQNTHPKFFKNLKDKNAIEIILNLKNIKAWRTKYLKELNKNGEPISWADIGVILDDPFYVILRDLVRFPDGRMGGYNRILGKADFEGGRAVAVLPVYRNKVLVLKQYRHPTRSWEYEIPRGYGESNIPPVKQAKNEIQEEIQGKINKLHKLGIVKENSGSVGTPVSLFMVELSEVGKPNRTESIKKLVWLSKTEFEKWIATGKISDGFTIAAYTRAKLKGLI